MNRPPTTMAPSIAIRAALVLGLVLLAAMTAGLPLLWATRSGDTAPTVTASVGALVVVLLFAGLGFVVSTYPRGLASARSIKLVALSATGLWLVVIPVAAVLLEDDVPIVEVVGVLIGLALAGAALFAWQLERQGKRLLEQ